MTVKKVRNEFNLARIFHKNASKFDYGIKIIAIYTCGCTYYSLVLSPLHARARKGLVKRVALPCPQGRLQNRDHMTFVE